MEDTVFTDGLFVFSVKKLEQTEQKATGQEKLKTYERKMNDGSRSWRREDERDAGIICSGWLRTGKERLFAGD